MSEHEFWNELGNLYFISGAYEPAIHAYARSIESDRGFGRPYSNLALALVHTGKYQDAIELYHRSIELLSDPKEKAVTWNRLGILYRQIKDYHGALVAYEQADKLDSRQDEEREEASRDVKYPLSVAMPPIDLRTILAKRGVHKGVRENFLQNVNTELQCAEPPPELQWFEGDVVPPDPAREPEVDQFLEKVDLFQEAGLNLEEGWMPLTINESIQGGEPRKAVESATSSAVNKSTVINKRETEVVEDEAGTEFQWVEINEYQVEKESGFQPDETPPDPQGDRSGFQWVELSRIQSDTEFVEDVHERTAESRSKLEDPSNDASQGQISEESLPQSLNESETDESQQVSDNLSTEGTVHQAGDELDFLSVEETSKIENDGSAIDLDIHSMEVTEPEVVAYSQVEYPLVELSQAEVNSIQIDISRFNRVVQINPRNAFAWEALGGLYKALGKFNEAISSYQKAIALDSTKPSYFYQLGLMYSAEGRDQEAMDAFQHVLSVNPDHLLAHASLGNLYRKMGLDVLAQQHIDIALKDVYEEENEYNQACLEAICGNTDRALELLQVAIEDNPSYVNWAQHDPDLEPLRRDHRFHDLLHSFAQAR